MRTRVEDYADSIRVVGVGYRDKFDLPLEIVDRIVTPQLSVGEIVEDVHVSDESEHDWRVGQHLVVPAGQEAVDVLSRLLPPAIHHQPLQEPHVEQDERLLL